MPTRCSTKCLCLTAHGLVNAHFFSDTFYVNNIRGVLYWTIELAVSLLFNKSKDTQNKTTKKLLCDWTTSLSSADKFNVILFARTKLMLSSYCNLSYLWMFHCGRGYCLWEWFLGQVSSRCLLFPSYFELYHLFVHIFYNMLGCQCIFRNEAKQRYEAYLFFQL